MFQRFFLLVAGAAYLGFSLPTLIDPQRVFAFMELATTGPIGVSEARGSYGGMLTAVGLFQLYAVYRACWRPYAFVMVAVLNAGYLCGRFLSAILDGPPPGSVWFIIAFELFLMVGAAWLYRAGELAEAKPH